MNALFTAPIEEEGGWRPGDDVDAADRGGVLEFHPFANLFPLIGGPAFDEFVEDVRLNGVREPIELFDGKILDGRNRYRAAIAAGTRYDTECLPEGIDPLGYVISKNLQRRHLNESQRAMIAAKLATMTHGGDRRSDQAENLPLDLAPHPAGEPATLPAASGRREVSQGEAAKALHVSDRSVRDAKTVREEGAPALAAAVERGEAAVSAAAAIARLPVDRQVEILDEVRKSGDGKKAFAKVAKQARAEVQSEKQKARQARERTLGELISALPGQPAGVVLEDFEWHFATRSEGGMDRHAGNHYPTARAALTPEEIVKYRNIDDFAAPHCVRFSWTTVPHLAIALKVLELSGFRYVSCLAWLKSRIITGYWNRGKHEILLISVRGDPVAPDTLDEKLPSWIEAMDEGVALELDWPGRQHSEKPEAVAEWIEKLWPTTPKIELNRRGPARPGWMAWGNEATETETTDGAG